MELVDILVLGTSALRRAGSNPAEGKILFFLFLRILFLGGLGYEITQAPQKKDLFFYLLVSVFPLVRSVFIFLFY